MTGARVYEDAALRVAADAGHLAEIDVRRGAQQVGVGVEGQLGYGDLRQPVGARRLRERNSENGQEASRRGILVVDVRNVAGFGRIFCERQSLISAMKMISGSRQSIWCVVANSPGAFPPGRTCR